MLHLCFIPSPLRLEGALLGTLEALPSSATPYTGPQGVRDHEGAEASGGMDSGVCIMYR